MFSGNDQRQCESSGQRIEHLSACGNGQFNADKTSNSPTAAASPSGASASTVDPAPVANSQSQTPTASPAPPILCDSCCYNHTIPDLTVPGNQEKCGIA